MIGDAVVLEVGKAMACADIDLIEHLICKSKNLKGTVIDYDGIVKNGTSDLLPGYYRLFCLKAYDNIQIAPDTLNIALFLILPQQRTRRFIVAKQSGNPAA